MYDSIKNDFVRGILKSRTLADVLCKLVKNQDQITEAKWPSVIFEICDRILPRRIFNSDIVPSAKQDIMFFINKGCVGIANVKRVPHEEDHKDYQYNAEENIVNSGGKVEDDDHLEDLIALVKRQKKGQSTNRK